MLTRHFDQRGFTFTELLVALLLTSLLTASIGQYLTTSLQVRTLMQQETLVAAAAEDLALQLNTRSLPPDLVLACSKSSSSAGLDLSLFCQAKQRLARLEVQQGQQTLVFTWHSPVGKRRLLRPTQ